MHCLEIHVSKFLPEGPICDPLVGEGWTRHPAEGDSSIEILGDAVASGDFGSNERDSP